MHPKTHGGKRVNRWNRHKGSKRLNRSFIFKFLCGKTICEIISSSNGFEPIRGKYLTRWQLALTRVNAFLEEA